MSAQIINGKEIAESVRQEISKEVQQLREKKYRSRFGCNPGG